MCLSLWSIWTNLALLNTYQHHKSLVLSWSLLCETIHLYHTCTTQDWIQIQLYSSQSHRFLLTNVWSMVAKLGQLRYRLVMKKSDLVILTGSYISPSQSLSHQQDRPSRVGRTIAFRWVELARESSTLNPDSMMFHGIRSNMFKEIPSRLPPTNPTTTSHFQDASPSVSTL